MTYFFDKIFRRYPIKTRRILEILPGSVSWLLILFPIWGSIFIPYVVAVFILFFDIYWFYRSFSLVVTSYIASKKIKKAESEDWLKNAKKLSDFSKVNHIIIIPNYQESTEKLIR